jgi:hypothetical protein
MRCTGWSLVREIETWSSHLVVALRGREDPGLPGGFFVCLKHTSWGACLEALRRPRQLGSLEGNATPRPHCRPGDGTRISLWRAITMQFGEVDLPSIVGFLALLPQGAGCSTKDSGQLVILREAG